MTITREEFIEAINEIRVAMNCSFFHAGNCAECPLNCNIHCGNTEDVLDVIASVEDWVKKHRKEQS